MPNPDVIAGAVSGGTGMAEATVRCILGIAGVLQRTEVAIYFMKEP
jgi:hypothetical protein